MGHLEAALGAHGRRIVVASRGETTDDLVRDMIEMFTSMCARRYGAGVPGTGLANRKLRRTPFAWANTADEINLR